MHGGTLVTRADGKAYVLRLVVGKGRAVHRRVARRDCWITADLRVLLAHEMTPQHMLNCLRMLAGGAGVGRWLSARRSQLLYYARRVPMGGSVALRRRALELLTPDYATRIDVVLRLSPHARRWAQYLRAWGYDPRHDYGPYPISDYSNLRGVREICTSACSGRHEKLPAPERWEVVDRN